MNIEVMGLGVYQANCSVVWGDDGRAWVFDPGAEPERIQKFLRQNDLQLGAVVLTHAHFDHISALDTLVEGSDVPVYLGREDEPFAFSSMNRMPPYQGARRPANLVLDRHDGDLIECGGLRARIITTPGHTPGGWCLLFEDEGVLIAGDTLFAGSVGRTDLPGGDWDTLTESLRRLKQLPDATEVICGHGPNTTIGLEKQRNPYL